MAITKSHEIHQRRLGRNVGTLVLLLSLAGVFFGLTIAKISSGDLMEGYDYKPRQSLAEEAE